MLPLAIVGLAIAVGATTGLLISGDRKSAGQVGYGKIPDWLPKPTVPVGRIVNASAAHPWLAIQGDTVSVDLARGRVLAVASGPTVAGEGHFPLPKTTPCTFTVTFKAASGVVPLNPRAFATTDEEGRLHELRVTAIGGGAVPQRVSPGRTVTLTMSAVLPTGEGRLLWAPAAGRPIVEWDFDVEID